MNNNEAITKINKFIILMNTTQQLQPYIYQQSSDNIPEFHPKQDQNPMQNPKILINLPSQQLKSSLYNSQSHLVSISDINGGIKINEQEISQNNQIQEGEDDDEDYYENGQTPLHESYTVLQRRQKVNYENIVQSSKQINKSTLSNNKKILPTLNIVKQKQQKYGQQRDIDGRYHVRPKKEGKNFRISEAKEKSNVDKSNLSMSSIPNEMKTYAEITNRSELSLRVSGKEKIKLLKSLNKNVKNQSMISQEEVLGNSRSFGVGNHRITQEDLQFPKGSDSQVEDMSEGRREMNKKQTIHPKDQQEQGIHQAEEANPQNNQQANIISTNLGVEDQKTKIKFYKNKSTDSKKKQDGVVVYYQHNNLQENIKPVTNQKQSTKNVDHKFVSNNQSEQKIAQNKNVLDISRIRTVKQEQNSSKIEIQSQIVFDPVTDNLMEAQIQRSQPKQEQSPQEPLQALNLGAFNIKEYAKVHDVLKGMHTNLKCPVINIRELLLSMKKYLEMIAQGSLDNIDEFDLILHKKKVLKNSLFLQRCSVIMLAFAYATHTVKQNLKYLINVIGFSLTNCLILIKIMQQTQILSNAKKSKLQQGSIIGIIQKADRMAMNRNFDILKNNNNVITDAVHKLSKCNEVFNENINEIMKEINRSSIEQSFYNLLEYFSYFLCLIQRDNMVPFLAIAPNPYLSSTFSSGRYTLVIDCVQIFCHSLKKSKANIFRPYSQHFLNEMSKYFQIVSYCSALPNQVDKVINMLDPRSHIEHRLYKHHTINNNKCNLKCLDRMGRNQDEMILLDNENLGGVGSLDNCIHVPTWKGVKNDTVLAQLCPLLALIALKKIPAREAVRKVREQAAKNRKQGVKYINFGIFLQ